MADEISMGEIVGQKLPHDLEMIVATFLPNLKYLEDVRDARQRSFTMRMFGIAISMSFLGYWAC